jgi:hypothetical protein
MEQLRESHAQAEGRLSRLEGAFVGLYSTVIETSKSVKELVEAQKRTKGVMESPKIKLKGSDLL